MTAQPQPRWSIDDGTIVIRGTRERPLTPEELQAIAKAAEQLLVLDRAQGDGRVH